MTGGRRLALSVAAALALAAAIALVRPAPPSPPPAAAAPRATARLATVRAERAPRARRLVMPAAISPAPGSVSLLVARTGGWVRSIRATTGALVRKGDVLATVESAELASAQRAYLDAARWASSVVRAGGRPEAAEQAAARLVDLGAAPEELSALAGRWDPIDPFPLRSPGAGFLVARALSGAACERGAVLAEVVDLATVSAVFAVPGHGLRDVRVGAAARVTVAGVPAPLAGRVTSLSPAVDPATRTARGRVALANPGLALRPGMLAEVTLEAPAADALAIPREAVLDAGGAPQVVVARPGGGYEARRIRLGARDGDRIEVLEGLQVGEAVVTAPAFLVDSESELATALARLEAAEGAPPPAPR